MGEEKLTLDWNDFQSNAANVFSELRKESEFSDVTLACNDDTMIKAHKVVLASCSPVFRKLFQQYNHPNPLIVLRGLSKSQLDNVITYAYFGRIEVEQSKLEAFLQLAEELKLKGLTPVSDLGEEESGSMEKKDSDQEIEEDKDEEEESIPSDDLEESIELQENDWVTSEDELLFNGSKNVKREKKDNHDEMEEDESNQDEMEEGESNQDEEDGSFTTDDLEESIDLKEDDWDTSKDVVAFKVNDSKKLKRERRYQPTNTDLEEILNLVNSHIVKLQDSANDFACSICGKECTSKNKSSLKSHVEAHPIIADRIALICSICDRMFHRTRRFMSHTKSCANK